MATLWLDKDYLVKRSVIDSNVQWDKITPIVDLVQRKYIKPILGTNLYNKLNTDIEAYINSATAIPATYKYLIDTFILEMLTHYILLESAPMFKFRYVNKGIVVKDSDNSQPIETNDMKYLMKIHKENGEIYGSDLIRYLNANNPGYPEYNNNAYPGLFPERKSYDVPIFLDNRKPSGFKDYSNINNLNDNPVWEP